MNVFQVSYSVYLTSYTTFTLELEMFKAVKPPWTITNTQYCNKSNLINLVLFSQSVQFLKKYSKLFFVM